MYPARHGQPGGYQGQDAALNPPPPYNSAPQSYSNSYTTPGSNAQSFSPTQATSAGGYPNEKQPYTDNAVQSPPQLQAGAMLDQNLSPEQQKQLQALLSSLPPEKMAAVMQAATHPQMAAPQPSPCQTQLQSQPPSIPLSSSQMPAVFEGPPISATYKPPVPSDSSGSLTLTKDAQKSGKAKRFFGDTLVGRFVRSGVQTSSAVIKMPAALSPYGDNIPITLPNVRYRDAVLFTTFAVVGAPLIDGADSIVSDIFGSDSFVSDIVSSGAGAITGNTILKYGIFQIVEQAIDKGIIEHMLPEEEKMTMTTSVTSLQVTIKHKLMGVDADLRYWGIYPAKDKLACDKGWFCPFLFASGRTPLVPRANDWAVAQSFGPVLGADYALAHKLLSESANVLALCEANPQTNIGTNRLLVLFTGISPYRAGGAGMWSTSRRPGCAVLMFHLMNGCPALVLPVKSNCPVTAWSPWTLSQMRKPSYNAEYHHQQICEWLDTVVSLEHLNEALRPKYEEVLGRSVSLVVNGALALNQIEKTVLGKVDPQRAGIIMLRY